MAFTPPAKENFKDFSVAGLTDMLNIASQELTPMAASAKEAPEAITEEQLDRMEELQAFIASANEELEARHKRSQRAAAASTVPAIFEAPAAEPEPVVAAAEEPAADPVVAAADGVKDVAATTPALEGEVVVATVTAAGAVDKAPRRSVSIADAAPYVPEAEVRAGDDAYSIVAAADIAGFPMGSELDWKSIGKAFEERVRSHNGMGKAGKRAYHQASLATIKRNFPEGQVVMEGDSHENAFAKLKKTSDQAGRKDALVAANGWCAPSTPDYSICSPITTDGLLSIPEMVLRRGGLLHNQGLDFGDFFGNDFVLPIPGYNILTEAQVIADTAKTCVEIPCPAFVDDRLNVAALCLTGSLLQNRGYPEFVSEFVQGAIAAMAHLVNREVINEIETGSTAITISGVDTWASDGSVWSQLMSAIDMVANNIRYIYRTSRTQQVQFVFPFWVRAALRADWIRRNATHTEDLTDAMVSAALSARNVSVQWVYDWQDAFDPANGAGAIDANHQLGNGAGPIAAALMSYPTSVTFLAFLPGTWVLGRQDVIRLDTVYDSTNLQQNLVTQLFMEDGYRPMRMCQYSFAYTINICPNGSTGVQRAVTCTDVTP